MFAFVGVSVLVQPDHAEHDVHCQVVIIDTNLIGLLSKLIVSPMFGPDDWSLATPAATTLRKSRF